MYKELEIEIEIAGATDVLPSVRRSYPPQIPDFPRMALVDPG